MTPRIITEMKYVGDKQYAVVTVQFERLVDGDEMEVLENNFQRGKIKVNPATDLEVALSQQVALELQEAYDGGHLTGHFWVESVTNGQRFADEMLSRKTS